MKSTGIFAFLALTSRAFAETERVINLIGERSMIFLGSQDRRYGGGVSYQQIQDKNFLRMGRNRGKLNLEGYVLRTWTDYKPWVPGDANFDFGILAQARYEFKAKGRIGVFVEGGWGLHFSDQKSYDLDSQLSSSPTIGMGVILKERNPITITTRLMHISNAGLKGHNKGQNQLWIMLGFRL
ncbi:MAG: acyloxyacyl hydrolase [Chthonomonas sp.]|nr:acyloxyacyl hydrolase [Chthonomonas sp.]